MSGPTIDTNAAQRFLDVLAPGELVTFQSVDESSVKRRSLSHVLHGSLVEHAATLDELNARGAAVCWMVNADDLKGRDKSNVQRIRALFVDLDGEPLQPVQAATLPAHCIVETSPGRCHAYWRLSDCSLPEFTPLQKALAARFKADRTIADLPRVMRLPGFDHRKHGSYRSSCIVLDDTSPPYTLAQFREAFALNNVTALPMPTAGRRARRQLPDHIPEGERNATLFGCARGLVQQGHETAVVNQRIQKLNAYRCEPPPCASEVDVIAEQVASYGAKGHAAIPRALAYSPEWKALPDGARTVAVLAYCRDDAADGCTFALTRADFANYRDLASNNTVHDSIAALLDSGILLRVSEPRNTQAGRKPALYAIAPKWRFRQVQNVHLAQSADSAPLHRKQSREAVAPASRPTAPKNGREAA